MKDGKGTYFWVDGRWLEGLFKAGSLYSDVIICGADGRVSKVWFENGKDMDLRW